MISPILLSCHISRWVAAGWVPTGLEFTNTTRYPSDLQTILCQISLGSTDG